MSVPFVRADGGGREVVNTVGSSGTSHEVDLADGNYHRVTLDDDCTFTFVGSVADRLCDFTLFLVQDDTGGHAVTWPGSVAWIGGEPTLPTDADARAVLVFFTDDDGTAWYGALAMADEDSGS